jgi:hypothetical protein
LSPSSPNSYTLGTDLNARGTGARDGPSNAESTAQETGGRQIEGDKLSFGLQAARCAVANKGDVDLTKQLFEKLSSGNVTPPTGGGPSGSDKIVFKGLDIAIIDGPDDTREVMIGTKLSREDADKQLEEFVNFLGTRCAVTEADGRRKFSIAGQNDAVDQVINLPTKGVFSSGLRFECNGSSNSITLTNANKTQKKILKQVVASNAQGSFTFDLAKIDAHVETIKKGHEAFVRKKIDALAEQAPYAKCFSEKFQNSPALGSSSSTVTPPNLSVSSAAPAIGEGFGLDAGTAKKFDGIFGTMEAAVDVGFYLKKPSAGIETVMDGQYQHNFFEQLRASRKEILGKLIDLEWQRLMLEEEKEAPTDQTEKAARAQKES